MIQVSATRPAIRQTTANFEYTNEGGETKVEEIVVRYFSRSIAQMRDVDAKVRTLFEKALEKKEPLWLSLTLPFLIESLPGVAGLDGKPIKCEFDKEGFPTEATIANFEAMPRHNLNAIEKAINEDMAPKEQPSK